MSLFTLVLITSTFAAPPMTSAVSPPGEPIDPANFDPAVPACQDFYEFATGGWRKAHAIPADKARYGSFEELDERNKAILHSILERTAAKRDWPRGSVEQKVGDFYASGMDEAAIERAGTAPISGWLSRIDGVVPKDVPGLLASLHSIGVGAGFDFDVDQDKKASTRYIVEVSQGGLGLPDRDYYLADDARSKGLRQRYLVHVARMLEFLGESPPKAKEHAADVLAFEKKLAQASSTRVELRDAELNYNRRTVSQLEDEAPGFGWKAYFSAMGVPEGQDLDVGQPRFAKAFAALFDKEPLPVLKTYLRWHLVREAAPFLPRRFVDENFEFYGKVLQGVETKEERYKRVLRVIDSRLGEALGQLYVRETFSPRAKERMKELVGNLRAALREKIERLPWMGPTTKAAAVKKLSALGVKIGYPDKWRDYTPLTLSRESGYFENAAAADAFETRRQVNHLGHPIDRTEWEMSPPTVNAYYNPTMNEIVFPAGILQPPFFWPEGDDAVNYGGIGVVIGHEMTHGFDDQGSRYDAQGNLRNWWTDADRNAYRGRTELMVKQFDGYRPFADASINGKLTLGENIADLGGLKISWAAFEKALGGDPNAAPLLGGFSPGQRFFLSYASVWRNNIREAALRVRLNTDPHSPGRWRVVGPVSNLPEFQRAFGCGPSTPMNRAESDRPVIW